MQQEVLNECKAKMEKSIESFRHALGQVRTGAASVSMLDPVEVDYYGMPTPLNQIAGISVVEGTQLVVKPFDPSSLKNIEKAINAANLNLTPMNDGTTIRINVPKMTEDVRKQTVKTLNKSLEDAKVSVRNIRRDFNDLVKKSDEFTEDMEKQTLEKVQKLTDETVKKLDAMAAEKTKEVMHI